MNTMTLTKEQTIPLSQLGRVVNVFFTPSRTFFDIRRNRSWWLPFLLTIICSYTLTLSGAAKVGFHQLTVNTINADPASSDRINGDLLPEQREATINTAETTLKISTFVTPALVLLYNVIYALLLWLGIAIAVGGSADFASIFAVLLYADLIQNIRAIGSTVVLFLTADPSSFNIQNALGTNLGFYLDHDSANWLRTLLGAVDVVTVWYLLLITLGCSIVAKISRASSATVVFGLWSLIVIAKVAWASLN
jgi:ABC-type multidrug transport system fused ATPase/permease subunit